MFSHDHLSIISHRGVAVKGVRNTAASISLAIEMGADMVEFDIRQVRDGLVVFHDATVKGVLIKKFSHSELIAKTGIDVPTPETILKLISGRVGMNIEIKEIECLEPLVPLIQQYCDPEHTLISSFKDSVILASKKILPNFQTGLLLGGARPINRAHTWISDVLPAQRIAECRPDYVIPRRHLTWTGVLHQIHALGIPSIVWAVESRFAMRRLMQDPRVVGIITDDLSGALALRA